MGQAGERARHASGTGAGSCPRNPPLRRSEAGVRIDPARAGEALTLLNQPAPLDADLPLRVGYGLGRCPDCAGLCGGRAELLDSRHDIDALGERVAEVIEENGHRGIGLRLCGVHEL